MFFSKISSIRYGDMQNSKNPKFPHDFWSNTLVVSTYCAKCGSNNDKLLKGK